MSATLIALICALAACFWFMVENAGLNDQNSDLRAERDDAGADRNLWQRRARDLGEQNYRLSVQLEEADAPLATIHHLPQVQRVAEVLAANEAKRHLTDERLRTFTGGGDAS